MGGVEEAEGTSHLRRGPVIENNARRSGGEVRSSYQFKARSCFVLWAETSFNQRHIATRLRRVKFLLGVMAAWIDGSKELVQQGIHPNLRE